MIELRSRLEPRRERLNGEAAPGAFAHLITPAALRFIRCNFPVPLLAEDHSVQIAGALSHPRIVRLDELRKLPALTITVVTECAGNWRTLVRPRVTDAEQWKLGAVSTAQWTGVPLRSLIELKDTALEVLFTGADGGGQFQRSLPREAAMDPRTLLCWEMNGEPIPPVFGGPLRLVVPGWYGMASVKWVERIDAITEPFQGHFQSERYVYAPRQPVTRVRIKSMFTEISRSRIAGLAWGGAGVARVEVAIGDRWQEARMVGPNLPHAWRRFELRWKAPSGRCRLRCRATDLRGEMQPAISRWNPLGYGANGVQEIEI